MNSLLHHLDLEVSLEEISRVLKPDGKLLFREPLGTNPVFQLYRYFTPKARTSGERPFTFEDLELFKSRFHFEDVSWFGFSNILSAFLRVEWLRFALSKSDSLFSKTPLKYLYWQFAGVARKKTQI